MPMGLFKRASIFIDGISIDFFSTNVKSRYHDYAQEWIMCYGMPYKFKAIHTWHPYVTYQQVILFGARKEGIQCFEWIIVCVNYKP
jgi:hypothetical protein